MNYLLFATKNGLIKKTSIDEYRDIRKSGLVAIRLDKNDQLLSTKPTAEKDEVILVTAFGKAIRFSEKDVRPTGRATRGVKGIRLRKNDEVVTMEVISRDNQIIRESDNQKKSDHPVIQSSNHLLVVTENGYGKMTPVSQYSTQSRGGQGVFTAKVTKKTGKIIDAALIKSQQRGELLLISARGQVIRFPLDSIPTLSRQTQGVKLINLEEGDTLASFTCLEKTPS